MNVINNGTKVNKKKPICIVILDINLVLRQLADIIPTHEANPQSGRMEPPMAQSPSN